MDSIRGKGVFFVPKRELQEASEEREKEISEGKGKRKLTEEKEFVGQHSLMNSYSTKNPDNGTECQHTSKKDRETNYTGCASRDHHRGSQPYDSCKFPMEMQLRSTTEARFSQD